MIPVKICQFANERRKETNVINSKYLDQVIVTSASTPFDHSPISKKQFIDEQQKDPAMQEILDECVQGEDGKSIDKAFCLKEGLLFTRKANCRFH